MFDFFKVLYLVGKQAYKLELEAKSKICDVFDILILEQNITKRVQANDELVLELEFKIGRNKEYEMKAIEDKAVYADPY